MQPSLKLLGVGLASMACALGGCRSKSRPNFEALLSLPPGEREISETSIARQLRERASSLSIPAEFDPGSGSDQRIEVRLRAADKKQALDYLDALCETGRLSVRAVHDRSAFLVDVAGKDPSQFPTDHEILTFSGPLEGSAQSEELVVGVAEIINNDHVERAEAEAGKSPLVHISLTISGGEQIRAASEKMRKGRSRLAIIYDERIISAPVVIEELGAQVTLEGFSSFEQARAVAASLNKPLSTELMIESLMPLAR